VTSRLRVRVFAPSPTLRAGVKALLDPAHLIAVEDGGQVGVLAGDVAWLMEMRFGALAELEGRALVALCVDPLVRRAFETMGLSGYAILPPDSDERTVSAAIILAAGGLSTHPQTSEPPSEPADDPMSTPVALTPRERDVLGAMARGLSNKQIAHALGIGESTVKFHVSALHAKLGAASRTEAVSRAARAGLITL